MFRGLSIWSSGDYYLFGVQGIIYLEFRGLFIWSSGDYLFSVMGIINLMFRDNLLSVQLIFFGVQGIIYWVFRGLSI